MIRQRSKSDGIGYLIRLHAREEPLASSAVQVSENEVVGFARSNLFGRLPKVAVGSVRQCRGPKFIDDGLRRWRSSEFLWQELWSPPRPNTMTVLQHSTPAQGSCGTSAMGGPTPLAAVCPFRRRPAAFSAAILVAEATPSPRTGRFCTCSESTTGPPSSTRMRCSRERSLKLMCSATMAPKVPPPITMRSKSRASIWRRPSALTIVRSRAPQRFIKPVANVSADDVTGEVRHRRRGNRRHVRTFRSRDVTERPIAYRAGRRRISSTTHDAYFFKRRLKRSRTRKLPRSVDSLKLDPLAGLTLAPFVDSLNVENRCL